MAELFSIRGKRALVTGGSRGIGRMIAAEFVRAGARVYICARRLDAAQTTASELEAEAAEAGSGGGCIAIGADLSDPGQVEALAAELARREDRLHILVNNAGTAWGEAIDTYPIDMFDKVLTVNVRAVFHLTQRLLPLLRAAATPEDPARVINIGSVDGTAIPFTPNYAYSASKAAVHMLTRHLAHALVGDHVTVNAIAPGAFETRLARVLFEGPARDAVLEAIPMRRGGTQEDVGGAAIFLASRAGAYCTGVILPVAGGVGTIDSTGSIGTD